MRTARAATVTMPDSTDLVFALHGDTLPRGYRFGLWAALVERLPWLAGEPLAGMHPLRVPATADAVLLLPRRARLALRIPRSRIADAAALAGHELDVDGTRVRLGDARERALVSHPTVHAAFVVAEGGDADVDDEQAFHRRVGEMLEVAGGAPRHICGRMTTLPIGQDTRVGASVALHGLAPAQSLWWQRVGLGAERRYGCGLMVPHKIIAGLD